MSGIGAEATQNAAAPAPSAAVPKPPVRSSATGSSAASPASRWSQMTETTRSAPTAAQAQRGAPNAVALPLVPWTPSTNPNTPKALPANAQSGTGTAWRAAPGTHASTTAAVTMPTGRFTANTDGQPHAPTRNPPSKGPATVAVPPTAAHAPRATARPGGRNSEPMISKHFGV